MSPPSSERISDYVGHWAARKPDREALIAPDGSRWRYTDLEREVDRCAAALVINGVQHGDRVALLGRPHPDCFSTFLACASIGAVWVGLDARYTLPELSQLVSRSEPAVLFDMLPADGSREVRLRALRGTSPARLVTREGAVDGLTTPYGAFLKEGAGCEPGRVEQARKRVSAMDPVAMIFTSGSTGVPKGALVPTGGLAYCGSVQAGRWYGDGVRKLCDLPLNHIGGLGDICCSVLTAGGTVAFMDRFDPDAALRLTERERLTHWYFIPTQLLRLVESTEWSEVDLSSLQRILWGGAAAPAPLLRTLSTVGAKLGTSYSLTESTGSVIYTDDDDPLDVLSWSVGRVDPNYDVRLADRNGGSVAGGEAGEILIRGDFITRGYFRAPEATAAAIDDEGWLHTGDLARWEQDGRIRLVGRIKEMFKSGGYNVYPREVEAALEQHPKVALAAVVGVADERWGEVGHAFVVARDDLDLEELERFARSRLASFKVPKALWLEPELPTLPIGKVDKPELRARAARNLSERSINSTAERP